jgi:hypothetical protein
MMYGVKVLIARWLVNDPTFTILPLVLSFSPVLTVEYNELLQSAV